MFGQIYNTGDKYSIMRQLALWLLASVQASRAWEKACRRHKNTKIYRQKNKESRVRTCGNFLALGHKDSWGRKLHWHAIAGNKIASSAAAGTDNILFFFAINKAMLTSASVKHCLLLLTKQCCASSTKQSCLFLMK